MEADAGECFARAKPRVIGGSVADLLATDCILLVIERKRSFRHGVDVQVIQRGVRGDKQVASNGE